MVNHLFAPGVYYIQPASDKLQNSEPLKLSTVWYTKLTPRTENVKITSYNVIIKQYYTFKYYNIKIINNYEMTLTHDTRCIQRVILRHTTYIPDVPVVNDYKKLADL